MFNSEFEALARRSLAPVLLASILSVWGMPRNARADTIFVDRNAAGADNGQDWTNAYTLLQSALIAAGSGDEVWVAQGTYHTSTGSDRNATFQIPDGVKIYGGFSGVEESIDERRPETNVTILSGNIGAAGNSSDNARHVVSFDGTVTGSTRLDGFIIEDGYADAPHATARGAGIYNVGGSPVIANCTIRDCQMWVWGGGMYIQGGSPVLLNCVFDNNRALYPVIGASPTTYSLGAGLGINGGDLTAINCIFRNNGNSGQGGGLFLFGVSGNYNLVNCLVHGNSAGVISETFSGGGGIWCQSGQLSMTNCTVSDNHSYGLQFGGGGLFVLSTGNDGELVTYNSIYWGNRWTDRYGETRTNQPANFWVAGVFGSPPNPFPDVQNCIVQGWNGYFEGVNNSGLDPLFVDPYDDLGYGQDFRVAPDSPAIDTGNQNVVPADVYDVDGDGDTAEAVPDLDLGDRLVDGDNDDVAVVDRGAYESTIPVVGLGGVLEPPDYLSTSGVNLALSAAPDLGLGVNPLKAFYYPADDKWYAAESGFVTMSWRNDDGFQVANGEVEYYVRQTPSPTENVIAVDYFLDWLPSITGAAIVELSRRYDVTVRYNSTIRENDEPGSILPPDVDVMIVGGIVQFSVREDAPEGQVLLHYTNGPAPGSPTIGFELVTLQDFGPIVPQSLPVGRKIQPPIAADSQPEDAFCQAVLRRNGTTADPVAWQQGTSRNIWPIRPSTFPTELEVIWYKHSVLPDGTDLNHCWPAAVSRHGTDWPNDPQENLVDSVTPPEVSTVDLRFGEFYCDAEVMYEAPLNGGEPAPGASTDGGVFTATSPGWTVLRFCEWPCDSCASASGMTFEVVRSIEHSDAVYYPEFNDYSWPAIDETELIWDIGTEVTPEVCGQVPLRGGGGIFLTCTIGGFLVECTLGGNECAVHDPLTPHFPYGYVHEGLGYNTNLYPYVEGDDEATGQIIPVNSSYADCSTSGICLGGSNVGGACVDLRDCPQHGALEVWYYEASRDTQDGDFAGGIHWPYVAQRYAAMWPDSALDKQILMANRSGAGPGAGGAGSFPLGSKVYRQGLYDDAATDEFNLPGFNPNDEHAVLLSFGGGRKVFAVRDDNPWFVETGHPYVLVQYPEMECDVSTTGCLESSDCPSGESCVETGRYQVSVHHVAGEDAACSINSQDPLYACFDYAFYPIEDPDDPDNTIPVLVQAGNPIEFPLFPVNFGVLEQCRDDEGDPLSAIVGDSVFVDRKGGIWATEQYHDGVIRNRITGICEHDAGLCVNGSILDGKVCFDNAACASTGTCDLPDNGFCDGGVRANEACTSDTACNTEASCGSDNLCAGGPFTGSVCSDDSDCAGNGACDGVCNGGSAPGSTCTGPLDCPGGGTCDFACVGGLSDGSLCNSNGDCEVAPGTCDFGFGFCKGGLDHGAVCENDNDCTDDTGTCDTALAGVCVGGVNHGQTCVFDADCPDGFSESDDPEHDVYDPSSAEIYLWEDWCADGDCACQPWRAFYPTASTPHAAARGQCIDGTLIGEVCDTDSDCCGGSTCAAGACAFPYPIVYRPQWPLDPLTMEIGETLTDGVVRDSCGPVEVLHDTVGMKLLDPLLEVSTDLGPQPAGTLRFDRIPPHLAGGFVGGSSEAVPARLRYDASQGSMGKLVFSGVMSPRDREFLLDVSEDATVQSAIDTLETLSRAQLTDPTLGVEKFLSVGNIDAQPGYMTLALQNDADICEEGDPVQVEVWRVDCGPVDGRINVTEPECVFSEKLLLQHSLDGGGEPERLAYQWQWSTDYNVLEHGDDPELATWNNFNAPAGYEDGIGLREVAIEGASIFTIIDTYWRVRYRGYHSCACNDEADCGEVGVCAPGVCVGDADDGSGCSTDGDCAGVGVCLMPMGTCSGGVDDGNACTNGVECDSGVCFVPGGICMGGADDGSVCSVDGECGDTLPCCPEVGEDDASDWATALLDPGELGVCDVGTTGLCEGGSLAGRDCTSDADCMVRTAVSAFTPPQLAEGWVKRVLRRFNAFDQRIRDFHEPDTSVATYVGLIQQAGPRYEGPIALNCDPTSINDLGLIETYETVFRRAKEFTLEAGITFEGVSLTLQLAASKITDLYMLLGHEAFADASDPTIGLFVDAETLPGSYDPSSVFAFQGQVPNLLSEELALLRGQTQTRLPDYDTEGRLVATVYNRLPWNFTGTDGQFAYANNYQVTTDVEARTGFPMGHGDAWGHYMTAQKKFYELLTDPLFEWFVSTESVLVGGQVVPVGFEYERKFARAAASRARTGAEITSLTFRQRYSADPGDQDGYPDEVDADRAWGVGDWARRAGQGAVIDWMVCNSLIDDEDTEHDIDSIQKVDRTTVTEISEIANSFFDIQCTLEKANNGLSPLGLAGNVVPFGLDPAAIETGKTHFDQIYERAVKALRNANEVFSMANENTQRLRAQQDQAENFADHVDEQSQDLVNRLIEVFGRPHDENVGAGKAYAEGYVGPDIFNFEYVDNVSELLGLAASYFCEDDTDCFDSGVSGNTVTVTGTFPVPVVDFDPDDPTGCGADGTPPESNVTAGDGAVCFQPRTVSFNISADGFGLIKPAGWGDRPEVGELQLARTEVLQAYGRFLLSLATFSSKLRAIEAQRDLIEQLYGLNDEAVFIARCANVGGVVGGNPCGALGEGNTSTLLDELLTARETELALERLASIAQAIGEAFATAIPEDAIFGLANGGSIGAPARGAVIIAANVIAEGLSIGAAVAAGDQQRIENQMALADALLAVDLVDVEGRRWEQREIGRLRVMLTELAPLEVDVYLQKEAVFQAAGRYQSALQRGLRLYDEWVGFRQKSARQITEYRYRDMAFRIFRNDALQKYRAQFDLASRYAVLAAQAYDYETNLLADDAQGGRRFVSDITRERVLGKLDSSGGPQVGAGLAGKLAAMNQNFDTLRTQLGFNNDALELHREFGLRWGHFRITKNEAHDAVWRETLSQAVVSDITALPEYTQYAIPLPGNGPLPGIVIPFATEVTLGRNFFGHPSMGDELYPTTYFAIKLHKTAIRYEDYPGAPLNDQVEVYLLPVGMDVTRIPSCEDAEPRFWRLIDQTLPVPNQLLVGDPAFQDPEWLPMHTFPSGDGSDMIRRRHYPAIPARSSEVGPDVDVSYNFTGRSVWNTQWLLIIPGVSLQGSDPDNGIEVFINGNQGNNGVSDIVLQFDSYGYAGCAARALMGEEEPLEGAEEMESIEGEGALNPRGGPLGEDFSEHAGE